LVYKLIIYQVSNQALTIILVKANVGIVFLMDGAKNRLFRVHF